MISCYLKLYYLKAKRILSQFFNVKSNYDNYSTKWARIIDYINYFNGEVDFIETGTYYGLTVGVLYKKVRTIYSIELNENLYSFNYERFKKITNVHIILGDSGKKLPSLLDSNQIFNNCIFWLDGHYSAGETSKAEKVSPIIEELSSILSRFNRAKNNWVILIDDLRLFDGIEYPLITEVQQIAEEFNFNISFDSDCIVLKSMSIDEKTNAG